MGNPSLCCLDRVKGVVSLLREGRGNVTVAGRENGKEKMENWRRKSVLMVSPCGSWGTAWHQTDLA